MPRYFVFAIAPVRMLVAVALLAMSSVVSCSGAGPSVPRSYPEPTLDQVLSHLEQVRRRSRSFRVESVMDYWVGDERVKGKVLMMGRTGARMRINALNPTGDNVAADLACDGIGFQYVDYNNDCQLSGPCTRNSIAELLRISLEPDDFLLMVMGTAPVIPEARGTVTWDPRQGHEVLELTSRDNQLSQTIVLDGRDQRWDILSSVVRDARGNELWSLRHGDFRRLQGADGSAFRVPDKTQLKQPQDKADLLVQWRERTFNLALEKDKFQMSIPPGLPPCR